MRNIRVMLGRDHDGVDFNRFAGFRVVADGDLRLGIRAQPRQAAILAQFALALHQPVRVINRRRHQLRGFVAGVTEHQALVAGTHVQIQALAFVNALGDVGRLLVVGHQHCAGLVVEADVGAVVADALDGIARDLDVIDVGMGGDFAGQHYQAGIHQRFGGHAGGFVLSQDGIEDRIGNLVGNLVGMPFGYRFRSKQEGIAHFSLGLCFI